MVLEKRVPSAPKQIHLAILMATCACSVLLGHGPVLCVYTSRLEYLHQSRAEKHWGGDMGFSACSFSQDWRIVKVPEWAFQNGSVPGTGHLGTRLCLFVCYSHDYRIRNHILDPKSGHTPFPQNVVHPRPPSRIPRQIPSSLTFLSCPDLDSGPAFSSLTLAVIRRKDGPIASVRPSTRRVKVMTES